MSVSVSASWPAQVRLFDGAKAQCAGMPSVVSAGMQVQPPVQALPRSSLLVLLPILNWPKLSMAVQPPSVNKTRLPSRRMQWTSGMKRRQGRVDVCMPTFDEEEDDAGGDGGGADRP